MAPDFDLRLRTMAAALTDIILPALPAGEMMALEQARLVLGSIELLRAQVDFSHAYEVTDARALIALVDKLENLMESPGADLENTRRLIAEPVCSTASVRRINMGMRSAACRLIEASMQTSEQTRLSVRQEVFDHEKSQILRERAWIAATGFDLSPNDVPSIAATLGLEDELT